MSEPMERRIVGDSCRPTGPEHQSAAANCRSLRKIIGCPAAFQEASRAVRGRAAVRRMLGCVRRASAGLEERTQGSSSRRPSIGSALWRLSEPRNIEKREGSYRKGA